MFLSGLVTEVLAKLLVNFFPGHPGGPSLHGCPGPYRWPGLLGGLVLWSTINLVGGVGL